MRFADVVATSASVAAESGRSAKRDLLAGLLAGLAPDEVVPAVGFLTGEARQGRIGVGWRTIAELDHPVAAEPTLTVAEVDDTLSSIAAQSGPGSGTARAALLEAMFGRATAEEARFLTLLLGGELHQGASAGVMVQAAARAAGVPVEAVRRAAMLGGRLDDTVALALTGGAAALGEVSLLVGRAVQPMLAATSADPASAWEDASVDGLAVVQHKLDGIRIQVHRAATPSGDRDAAVRVFTRNLNDITERLPGIVAVVADLPGGALVLDGEALVTDPDGRPVAFQDTAGRVSADEPRPESVRPYFFDALHADGVDLIDAPLSARLEVLDRAAGSSMVAGATVAGADEVAGINADALAAGQEGIVVKDPTSTYAAGRRGKAWRKVKPVHTLDLVVLAAEWGHGRRRGWLSNLHLGARDPAGGFVMVGKTFKGLTDALLGWQTDRLSSLARSAGLALDGHVVEVPPELVVEIAVDGVQRSTRYDGGVALRFARVVRYREDKKPGQADTIEAVRALG
ncbi:MAG: ATP-dependent DNA ligase [Microthrixaceae bacterium]